MKNLSEDERYLIALHLRNGHSQKWIADQLGRSESTISRELERNSCPDGGYRFHLAHQRARNRKRYRTVRPKILIGVLRRRIKQLLGINWSPEQVSEHLRAVGFKYRISHQTIYKYLWSLSKCNLIRKSMRRGGRRPRRRKPGFVNRARLERRSIHTRPDIVQQRGRLGDWELDLVVCNRNTGYLITAVDRMSGYTLIGRTKRRKSGEVMTRIVEMFRPIAKRLRKTFTFDNGSEFYYFKHLERELGVTVYYADPYNSGQRGTNENTNGLIRQYFPKRMRYGSIKNKDIETVVRMLNNRPRKRLKFQTPKTVFKSPQKIAIQI